MNRCSTLLLALAVAAALPAARAQDGHDHDHDAPAAGGPAIPRVSAQSDLFELVGIVDHGVMTVYLDRFATNEPVTGARIEYEAGPHRGVAQPQADGTYRIAFEALAQSGELPFAFTVSAGSDMDLLAGELDLHVGEEAHGAEAATPALPKWLLPLAGAAAAIALAAVLLGRRRTGSAA